MQFNFVLSTNERAVHLWQRHSFEIVGRIPGTSCIRASDMSTPASCIADFD